MTIVREGHGSGEGRGNSPGEVHDIALKAAETDATKRALATFGKPFGLELYRKDKNTTPQNLSVPQPSPPIQPRFGSHPDDTTPIPRPSHYYGRRHQGSMAGLFRRDQANASDGQAVAPPSAIAAPFVCVGLDPHFYGTHSLRRTKATVIYRRTGNLRAVQLLLGHTKIESTVRYLGIDLDDALTIAEQVDV
jgi:Rad52/22 family double-strand break repair protein/integrase-like protein